MHDQCKSSEDLQGRMYEKVAVVPISIVALTTTTIDINC